MIYVESEGIMIPITPYQNQLQNLQSQIMSPAPSVQYVNGKQSADNYAMQPNSSVILMDSNMDRFYLKKSDASGMCTLEAYDFHKAADDVKPEYVTREEFDELKNMIKERSNEQHYESSFTKPITSSEPGTVIVG